MLSTLSMKRHLLALTLVAFAAPVGVAQAAVVTSFNSTFEEEAGNEQLNYTGFQQWNVISGTVDLISTPQYGITCNPGVCVDTDGTGVSGGTIETKDSLATGTYKVKFDIAGNQRGYPNDTLTFTFGSYIEAFTMASNDPWTTIIRTITIGSASTLKFSAAGYDYVGIVLDNVSASPVPVPAALPLFATALGGIGLLKLRRKRRAQAV